MENIENTSSADPIEYIYYSESLQMHYLIDEKGGVEFTDKVRYSADEIHRLRRAKSLYDSEEKYSNLSRKIHMMKKAMDLEVGMVLMSYV